jgi:LmbE family N-acetylglucosaminyl deacetylase
MSFRSGPRALKRALARLIEGSWRLGWRAAALTKRGDARRWSSPGAQQVLVVAPHPDDEAIGCAGTVLLHVQAGDRVCVAIATDGGRSKAMADPAAMRWQRLQEALDAARLMRVDRVVWIGLPEGEWCPSDLQQPLAELMAQLRPDIIYAPSRIDFHPEHLQVAHALALALAGLPTPQSHDIRLRIYQIQVPLSPVISNLVADVSAVQSASDAVLRTYASQSASVQCAWRHRRYSAAWHGIAGAAEEFFELSAQRYAAMHGAPPAQWPQAFRGMRNFPMSDPLAYLTGMAERRRIRACLPASGR